MVSLIRGMDAPSSIYTQTIDVTNLVKAAAFAVAAKDDGALRGAAKVTDDAVVKRISNLHCPDP